MKYILNRVNDTLWYVDFTHKGKAFKGFMDKTQMQILYKNKPIFSTQTTHFSLDEFIDFVNAFRESY